MGKPEDLPLLASGAVAGAAPARRIGTAARVPARLLGVALVAGSAFTFSLLSTLIKVASASMPSMETVFWRSFVAWALNFAAIQYYQVSLHVPRAFWRPLAVRCLVGTCAMSFGFFAIQQMVLADASVLLFTSPIWTFFLGALVLHERIDTVSFGFALLSFVGVVFVARPPFIFGRAPSETKTSSTVAIVCALLSSLARSVVYVSMRRLQQLHFMVVIHYYLLTTTIISAFSLLIIENNFVTQLPTVVWLAVLGAGGLGFVGQLLLTRGFQLEKAGIASVMRNLDVVFVFVWDLTLLHESISPWSIAGALLICGCAIMIARRRLKT